MSKVSGILLLLAQCVCCYTMAGEVEPGDSIAPVECAIGPVSCDTLLSSLGIENDSIALGRDSINYGLGARQPSIYDFDYSRSFSLPNKRRLIQNTAALYVAGVATLGVLELLPENATAWNKEELHKTPFFKRWWMHVKKGAVWDHDNWVFNYVLHPYGGAAYYMSARTQGLNALQSSLYSFGVSTFFWEYGIEAFMEYPSVQDLIITPVVGSIIGEQFYKIKRHIVANNYRLLDSGFLGHLVCFLVDPVNEFMDFVIGKSKVKVASLITHHHVNVSVVF